MIKNLTWRTFIFLFPLLFWGAIFSIRYFSGLEHLPPGFRQQYQMGMVFFDLMLVCIFYLHSYLIYPVREAKNGTLLYVIMLAGMMLVYLTLHGAFRPHFPNLPMPSVNGRQ